MGNREETSPGFSCSGKYSGGQELVRKATGDAYGLPCILSTSTPTAGVHKPSSTLKGFLDTFTTEADASTSAFAGYVASGVDIVTLRPWLTVVALAGGLEDASDGLTEQASVRKIVSRPTVKNLAVLPPRPKWSEPGPN